MTGLQASYIDYGLRHLFVVRAMLARLPLSVLS